jgi:curved DNA-binding protein
MDYYSILGVPRSASPEEIKKAYKKLAMKHHPDRGGDSAKFKEINEAYSTLSDPQKKAEYDNPQPQMNFGGFPPGFDPFNDFGSMFGFNPQGRTRSRHARNRDLNFRCRISFEESLTGKNITASYNLPSGRAETVDIRIPPGVDHGQTIRYHGLGDDSHPGIPRGHLDVIIDIENNTNFTRNGLDIYTEIEVDAFDAMTGCDGVVKDPFGTQYSFVIRPGTQHGTKYNIRGRGVSNNNGVTGNFIVNVKVKIPTVVDSDIKEKLENIKNEISVASK